MLPVSAIPVFDSAMGLPGLPRGLRLAMGLRPIPRKELSSLTLLNG
jgi:hypothetical protein